MENTLDNTRGGTDGRGYRGPAPADFEAHIGPLHRHSLQ